MNQPPETFVPNVRKVRATEPPRVTLYGPQGCGKTTLASEFPNPIYLQCEEGTPGDIELNSFGQLNSFDDMLQCFVWLASNEHDFKTVVVDTSDAMEKMIHRFVCESQNPQWSSIEEPGYGKGYVEAESVFIDRFLSSLTWLRTYKRMNVVVLAHSDTAKMEPPGLEPYSKYVMRTHKRVTNALMDWCDIVGFINQRVEIKQTDVGFGKTAAHATGGGSRWLHVEERAAYTAKNRYGMPPESIVVKGSGFQNLFLPYAPFTV